MQVGRPAREKGPVDQVANDFRRHAAVAEKMVDARVDGHDAVEDAGLRVGVELDQDRRLRGTGHSSETSRPRKIPSALEHHLANGCLTVSFLAVISAIGGWFFMARSMESLVAS